MTTKLASIKQKAPLGLSLLLLLANQIGAYAGTYSDKTQWLTNSLDMEAADTPSIPLKALPAKEDTLDSSTITLHNNNLRTVKLRPFVANRKLPSRRDLELALIEQKAKSAQEENTILTGQVSTSVNSASLSDTQLLNQRASRSYSKPAISINRACPKSIASSQAAFAFMKQAEQRLLTNYKTQYQTISPNSIATPLRSNTNSEIGQSIAAPPTENNLQFTCPNTLSAVDNSPSAFSLPQPISTNKSQSFENNCAFGSAGPPPFPLNLLPETSLKQLVRSLAGSRTRNSNNAPAASFGSWHAPVALSNVAGSRTNLAYGGFQSHLPNHGACSSSKKQRLTALHTVTGAPLKSSSKHTQNSANSKDAAASNRMLLNSQVKVATYPFSYMTQSLKLWNFAQ